MTRALLHFLTAVALAGTVHAAEFHVATTGQDTNQGTQAAPLHTIQRVRNWRSPAMSLPCTKAFTGSESIRREVASPRQNGSSIRLRQVRRWRSKVPKSPRPGRNMRGMSGS